MPRIHQLSHSVVTKIAAGEVIERPASVVKELLENSIDAGSTRIEIEVEQGGTDRIQIVDDGCGIHADDLALVFASHATSKLRNADDLFQVGTLGFRGEAMASVGGVAQVTLQSRTREHNAGAEISCDGGEISAVRVWNGSPGTRIQVKHLFFNTPVRRKFLRTTSTEMGHVCEVFTRIALSHPTLHLTLRHNGKQVYEVPASAGLVERIGLFFGAEVQKQLYPVQADHGLMKLRGLVADPALEKGNAKLQYLFLNNRWIRDRSISHALQEAYRGLLMTGRYAVAFLFLEVPPDQVDVNVHPTKSEVRFRESSLLYSLVLSTIRRRLCAENLTAKLRVSSTLDAPKAPPPPVPGAGVFEATSPLPSPQLRFPEPRPEPVAEPNISLENDIPILAPEAPLPAEIPGSLPHQPQPLPSSAAELESAFARAAGPLPPAPVLPQSRPAEFKAIQLYNAYLVLETPEGMLVLDQHALHERILFEQLKTKFRQGALETQSLLIPETIDLTPDQAALTLEHKDALADLGLIVEDFGNGTLLLHSYPAVFNHRSPERILRAVVDYLVSKDRAPAREHLLNDILSLMACHSAVRAGDPLSADQIANLVEQRQLADDHHHCPHGRPTALLFTKQDLDRQFGRI
jgi:DNA mismatch repair protein MutL